MLILAGDHVYKMDYGKMLAEHVWRGARMSIACVEVPVADARGLGVMQVDDKRRITGFQEKPASTRADARQARTPRSRAWASTCSMRRFSTTS